MCDDRKTTHADSNAILADFGRRCADGRFRGGGNRITVVLPGDEPHEYRVFVCANADEAAACLHRHWWGRQGGTR